MAATAAGMGQTTGPGRHIGVRFPSGPFSEKLEPLQVAIDNGAKKVLLPIESKRQFLEVSGDIMVKVDLIFYEGPQTAAVKAIEQ